MMRPYLFRPAALILLIFLFSLLSRSQERDNYDYFNGNLKKMFIEAESFLLYEEYKDALHLFKLLKRKQENNRNIDYKIGLCYLHVPGNVTKAIHFLEKACERINQKASASRFKETNAPPDALYELGNAYRIANKLDQAIEKYKAFKEKGDPDDFDFQVVDDQIQTCKYAKKLMDNPIKLEKENLGSPINNASSNIKPVISGNKERMVYVSKKKFYDAIFMCTREPNGEWSEPHNIIPQLGVDNRIYPTSLSHDGQTLYLYRNEDFGGDIYVSKLIDDQWTEVEKLNRKINTKYWESHASITRDGKTLFFTSNRDGGYGGLDIYISQKNEDDEWGDPENCGPVINSKYDEHTPFPANNGTTLYFSSDGHLTMGGFDIFRSDKQGEKWTKPENLGYPINTTSDDVFFHPIEDRKTAIYSIFSKKEGFGQEDIYLIHFDSKQSTSWLINNK